jgi:nucleoside 2-deoxyribosyltransferase
VKTIVFCASSAFYEHVNQLADELADLGFKVVVPYNARGMKKSGNYNVESTKTWFENPDDFKKKTNYMRWHFDEVAKGDAVLVVNDEKRGIKGYIGSNVLLEMGLAFHLKKPIYILNPVREDLPNYEEIIGMEPIFLNGGLKRIKK